MSDWKKYRKTATVEAMLIEEPGDLPAGPRLDTGKDTWDEPVAHVDTLEGKLSIRFPFYLVRGFEGELYPVDVDVFEETYELDENFLFGLEIVRGSGD